MAAAGIAEVRCRCGAWSAARDDESVACAECATRVVVPYDVRLYVRCVDVETEATFCCAQCGHSLREESERCRWCRTDVTARVRRASRAIVRDRFPVALRSARGIFCGACSHPLERAAPSAHREFAACGGCGRDNHSTHVLAMLAMQRYLTDGAPNDEALAALDHADSVLREARRPVALSAGDRISIVGRGLLAILLYSGICGVVYAGLVTWLVPSEVEPKPLSAPRLPPSFKLPGRFTKPEVGPDECARVGSGVCLDDYVLRRCTDAGVVEDESCVRMSWLCMRDACEPGAHCCPLSFDAGASD